MRQLFVTVATIFSLALDAHATSTESVALSAGWTFRQERLTAWHPATVPGTVHTDLMALGRIEDPFFGLNERTVQWIDKENWLYDNYFEVSDRQQQRDRRELTFYGLDTYADVWFNDSLILCADNMFRTWKADVTQLTRAGRNHLRVRLHSPVKMALPRWQAYPEQYPASSDQSENGGLLNCKLSPFIRKAPYHFGWDWGPRLVTMGIWRPVVFTAWDNAIIRDVFVEQKEVTRKRADIVHHVTIEASRDAKARITVMDSASQRQLAAQTLILKRGINEIALPYTIRSPRLWWTNGLGEPYLYHLLLNIESSDNSESIALHASVKVGLRDIRLHRVAEADDSGEAFYFTLNGERLFMKGANYIPCDVFLPRVTDSIYRRTVCDAAAANMNMLRVWGGGVYEDDRFYELCDEHGLLVWQDFMFACSMYPADSVFLDNIRREAIDNVRRLRNHPCIALWCGNNEILDAWTNWGWKRQSRQHGNGLPERLWMEYEAIFKKTLPEVVATYAPQTPYQSSSPLARDDGRRDFTRGDYHYWEVWHERKPISEYNRARARFFSEYGMQSFPELSSVKRFCPDTADWHINSDVMMSHQRGGAHANELIAGYLSADYSTPDDFAALLYTAQLMQGEAMKTAAEAHRRDKGYCWGSLVWQLNDCWPVASWSTRDYYGRWKAAHYKLRHAMADILVSPIVQADSSLHVYVVNDRLTPVRGKLVVQVWSTVAQSVAQSPTTDAQRLMRQVYSSELTVTANSSHDVWQMSIAQLLGLAGIPADEAVIHAEFCGYTNDYTLVPPKDLKLARPQLTWAIHDDSITITTDRYAHGIFLNLDGDASHHFSDNFFDLLPGQSRTVALTTILPSDQLRLHLTATSY